MTDYLEIERSIARALQETSPDKWCDAVMSGLGRTPEYITRRHATADFCGETQDIRACEVTGKKTETRWAYFKLWNADGEPAHFYRTRKPVTRNEFKALCARIIPDINDPRDEDFDFHGRRRST